MGMLTRYQKSGGFIQLLQLIETCGKTKQDNFLSMIEKEDSAWSDAIRTKMLTIEKVLSWDNANLAEVAARLQELTLATALHGLKPEDGDRLLQTFTHSQRRNIDDLKKSKTPLPAELSSAFMKILIEVRSMITQGYLRVDKFAPELHIPENIEETIGKDKKTVVADSSSDFQIQYEDNSAHSEPATKNHKPSGDAGHSHGSASEQAEVSGLRTKVQHLAHENTQLKSEVKVLREKLAQIKKIA